jgi:pimeloyl-ACP methyl ester carboxylesterase
MLNIRPRRSKASSIICPIVQEDAVVVAGPIEDEVVVTAGEYQSYSSTNKNAVDFPNLHLGSLIIKKNRHGNNNKNHNRIIQYATAGNYHSPYAPVLVFLPNNDNSTSSNNRRNLALFHSAALQHNLKLLTITAAPPRIISHDDKERDKQQHSTTTTTSLSTTTTTNISLQDIDYVLQHLNITKVSLLSCGTGTTLALAFFCRRRSTTGVFMALSPHVRTRQPDDTNNNNECRSITTERQQERGLFRRGRLVVVAANQRNKSRRTTIKRTTSSASSVVARGWRRRLTKSERVLFDETLAKDKEFINALQWIREEEDDDDDDVVGSHECVSLSSKVELGMDCYDDDANVAAARHHHHHQYQQRHVVLWRGQEDKVVPYDNVEWLSRQLLKEECCRCELNVLPNASHEGLMMISLYPSIVQSFRLFRVHGSEL